MDRLKRILSVLIPIAALCNPWSVFAADTQAHIIDELRYDSLNGVMMLTLETGHWGACLETSNANTVEVRLGTHVEQMVSVVLASYMAKSLVTFTVDCVGDALVASQVKVNF